MLFRSPLTKLLLQPEHEKKNLMISNYIEKERGKAVYIVCSRKDHLKNREVSPEDILKWVSQRTLEEFSVREYERYEEIERVKEQKEKAQAYAVMCDSNGNPSRAKKKGVGRPRKSRQVSEDADEYSFREVMPAKKSRAAQRISMVVGKTEESEGDPETSRSQKPSLSQQPSLSHRPSLSQPVPNLKRKHSQVVSRKSTPEESTDGHVHKVLEAMEARRLEKKLSIRRLHLSSPQAKENASLEARARRTPPVEISAMESPFRNPPSLSPSRQFLETSNAIRKESSSPVATFVHVSGSGKPCRKQSSSMAVSTASTASMPPSAIASQTRIKIGRASCRERVSRLV